MTVFFFRLVEEHYTFFTQHLDCCYHHYHCYICVTHLPTSQQALWAYKQNTSLLHGWTHTQTQIVTCLYTQLCTCTYLHTHLQINTQHHKRTKMEELVP